MPASQIRQYQTYPVGTWPEGASGQIKWTWESTMSIDLQWVAAAKPWTDRVLNATQILLCGSGQWDTINVPYDMFMADWTAAKGL